MLRHDKEEKFFPVMTGTFWLNVVLQSAAYLIYIQLPSYDSRVSLNNELVKFAIVALFFLSIALFYFCINNAEVYAKAESWFLGKSKKQRTYIKVITGSVMIITFLGFLFCAIYQM
tara:strand:+ start:2769 stop:3116 length:348 start_codon:yes stop_codon:yes gene_type:complete